MLLTFHQLAVAQSGSSNLRPVPVGFPGSACRPCPGRMFIAMLAQAATSPFLSFEPRSGVLHRM
eukprot:1546101-Rhodomonas_salina.1